MKCSPVLSDTKLHLKEGWEVTIALFNEKITQWNDWFNETKLYTVGKWVRHNNCRIYF